jgi:DNA adenine methylase
VEVFAGAAWVLFGKDPAISTTEILNDANGELANFFRCVRDIPSELMEKLEFRLLSRADFFHEKKLFANGNGQRSEIERAAAFYWVLRNSFGSKGPIKATFGYVLGSKHRRYNYDVVQQVITAAHERLRDVYIFNEDFEALITRCDRSDTFFYCDPPYYGCESCYDVTIGTADHERLAKVLRNIKGKFLLSYNNCEEIRKLYRSSRIEEVSTSYSLPKGARQPKTELLIRNY